MFCFSKCVWFFVKSLTIAERTKVVHFPGATVGCFSRSGELAARSSPRRQTNGTQRHREACNSMQRHAEACTSMQRQPTTCNVLQHHATACNGMQRHAMPWIQAELSILQGDVASPSSSDELSAPWYAVATEKACIVSNTPEPVKTHS